MTRRVSRPPSRHRRHRPGAQFLNVLRVGDGPRRRRRRTGPRPLQPAGAGMPVTQTRQPKPAEPALPVRVRKLELESM
jgi:hypothetical protein